MLKLMVILAAAVAGAGPSPAPSIESILQGLQPDSSQSSAPPAQPFELTPSGPPSTEEPEGPPPPALNPPPPQAPPTADQYDDKIRGAARAAEAQQGPLDGGWILSSRDDKPLYRFQLVDRGLGYSLAEAAWLDLAEAPAPKPSGFVAQISYDGSQLMLRFYEKDSSDLVVVTLKSRNDGRWSGELWRAGAVTQVVLKRA